MPDPRDESLDEAAQRNLIEGAGGAFYGVAGYQQPDAEPCGENEELLPQAP